MLDAGDGGPVRIEGDVQVATGDLVALYDLAKRCKVTADRRGVVAATGNHPW